MRIIELTVALAIFIGSACMAALVMALLVRYALGVPPAALGLNALISAGALGFILVVIIGAADERE